jgi:hypothetical protein
MTEIKLEQTFFGRTDLLGLLKRRVIDLKEGYRQNVALIGNQFVGKSMLLQKFLADFEDEEVVIVYLDLDNKDFGYFLHKYCASLLYYYSKNQKLPLHDDLNLLIETTKNRIPYTVDVIKKLRLKYKEGKITECYQGLLALPEIFTNETKKFCILIYDEFQNIDLFDVPQPFQDLGKKIMTQKRCLYILSSSSAGAAKKILSEKLSLLFGNFEVINVEPFDLESSRTFLTHLLRKYQLGELLMDFLIDFTGGHPLYLTLISRELVNLSALYQQKEIYIPILTHAVENTIFDRWGVLSRHFELMIQDLKEGKDNQTPAILISLANGKNQFDDICNDTGHKTSLVKQTFERLLETGVAVKNGKNFHFKDKLFKYWVKYVYQRRLKDVELESEKQRLLFREELNRVIEDFKFVAKKDFTSRILELLACFENESFDINGRKYKLQSFKKITPIKCQNDSGDSFDVIHAVTDDAVWLIALKKGSFAESDVNTILKEIKKGRKKPERCVIVSLSGLDENTRLRALQERFWIWNEGEINTLLTLFDKPYITQ